MATPNVAATLTFVKRYPIVLCGFSLFFMPSVHRLLLYFTPLLLSTAIFIVAMMSWGSSASSERGKRRGKRKGADDWSFNAIDEEDEVEDEEMEDIHKLQEEIPQKGKSSKDMQQNHISEKLTKDMQQDEVFQKGKPSHDMQHGVKEKPRNAEPDPDLELEAADTDLAEEHNRVGTASNEAVSSQLGGQSDPDLHRGCVGTASNCASVVQHAEPDPDLQRECMGTASNCASAAVQHAEPDPDLHAEQKCFRAAQHDHAAPGSHHLLSSSAHDHHQAEPAQLQHDQHAPAPQDHHQSEPDPDMHRESAEPTQMSHDQLALALQDDYDTEPDPDLHRESADAHIQRLHAGSKEEYVEGDLHAAVSELRPQDMELAKAAVERLEASLGITSSSHQPAPDRLQALHAAA